MFIIRSSLLEFYKAGAGTAEYRLDKPHRLVALGKGYLPDSVNSTPEVLPKFIKDSISYFPPDNTPRLEVTGTVESG